MNDTKHTPGPLHAKRAHSSDNTGGRDYCIHDDQKRIVAECFEHAGINPETGEYIVFPAEANAHLYSASPAMFQQLLKDALVLESYAELLEDSAAGIAGELAALAAGVRATIAQATGGQS